MGKSILIKRIVFKNVIRFVIIDVFLQTEAHELLLGNIRKRFNFLPQ